ncbi:MAG: hypothetical protein HRT35_02645 [Algicola sp.]|nr:hypothetical protein [Algicola sp.]
MSSLKTKKERVNEVMQLILEGMTYLDACKHVNIQYSVFLYWVTNIKACVAIKDEYEKQKLAIVETALFRSAVGFEYDESHVSKRGKKNQRTGKFTEEEIIQKKITKRVMPNVHAQMLYLTNKDPENWVTESEAGNDLAMQLEMIRQTIAEANIDNDIMEDPPQIEEVKEADIVVKNKSIDN